MSHGLADTPTRSHPGIYRQDPEHDEALAPDGTPRGRYGPILAALLEEGPEHAAARAAAWVARGRIAFSTPDGHDAFRVDVVPRLIEREEWDALAAGLCQRVRALNAFLADAYGERRIVAAGRVPARIVDGAAGFDPGACGLDVPGGTFVGVAGLDVIRPPGGALHVLEDNLRTPSGAAYARAACDVVAEALPCEPPARVGEPSLEELLGEALRASAPDGRGDPSIVLLSDGPLNSAWWEHVVLAELLAVPLVTPGDLEVRAGRLMARVGEDGAAIPVDVVYRRTDEDRLHGRDGEPTELGRILLEPLRGGRVACVNAFGAGIADDKLVHAYVEEMIRFYLAEEPLIPSVRTYDPAEPTVREAILERVDELVVKPRDGYGGDGVIVAPHASAEDRRLAAEMIRRRPEDWVAQETVMLSTHPTVVEGRLEPRHVDLRPFVYSAGGRSRALPGGLTRVALDDGALVVNSSQNGGGKATWVLA